MLTILKNRFDRNRDLHPDLSWEQVERRLRDNEAALAVLASELKKGEGTAYDTLWTWLEAAYPDLDTMDSRDYVLILYEKLLGRGEEHPEQWADLIDRGEITRRDAFTGFMQSQEFRDRLR